ncbi:phosphate transport system permease protein [Modicisalibacter ilicicola DSM 19980]|uniref:Phosphate transport system permease protein n=1 Tax=Modicisalibacter ilicicola DSM 19980 TaxID=1121942 RepID=A0A1M4VYK0_9GAMM|nr:ABC transporter permease subunit [Halomonas ilicicola]SHE73980.1 phosphate transport system permease protein [Halomonas ilicicola DSM 19980]
MTDPSPATPRLRGRLRQTRDRLATLAISAGGIGVVMTVLAIGVFLAIEVLPLFVPSQVTTETHAAPAESIRERAVWMHLDDRRRMTLLGQNGRLWQVPPDGDPVMTGSAEWMARLQGQRIVTVAESVEAGLLVLGLAGGDALLVPRLPGQPPAWPEARRYTLFADASADELALGKSGDRWWLAGRDPTGRVAVLRGETGGASQRLLLPDRATHLAFGNDGRLVLAEGRRLMVWSLKDGPPRRLGERRVLETPRRITALSYLAGGETLLVGDSGGGLRRWLNARGDAAPLVAAQPYATPGQAAITRLLPLPDERLALALDGAGSMALYQAVAGLRWTGAAPPDSPRALTFGPPGHTLWWLGARGLQALTVDAEHAEVSWATLWTPTLYEGHEVPRQRWQASAPGIEDEARFGLAPLAWGTLKAAAWALLFAVPIALGAAIYSAVYMSARLRTRIKPTIELMEALPGVVIGFVAGLVLAPFVERHLAGALAVIVLLPFCLWLAGVLWARLPRDLRRYLPFHWAGLWLIPWLALWVWLALASSPFIESLFFAGDLGLWLQRHYGLDYAQRNTLIVGLAMGFAVIPTIYALAEDALAGVPKSLDAGAQALGATRWQALWRVVLPAASPGLFSAVMIGAGRAVGETMIVLMATGNTALMAWSPFEGLRSTAATIAIELPEAAAGTTHYRLLFLSALLLFVFTFCVNTLAELVRQRLRRNYRRLGAS